jgi:hypothetical protein
MTEAEWLACTDPKPGVTVVPSFVPDKKNGGCPLGECGPSVNPLRQRAKHSYL